MAKKDIPSIVGHTDFPNHLTPDSEKLGQDYGLEVAKAIQYEWFNKSDGSCRYYKQRSFFNLLRLYARGEQPIKKYKDALSINGDTSQLNVDWQNVPIIPKFVDIIANGMSDRMFTPKAYAEDITSSEARDSYQRNIEKDMIAKDFLMQTQAEFGIDAFNVPPDQLPETPQELQLHMQLDYKPGIEIAAETAISTVFKMNSFDDVIKYRFNLDQVTLGIGVVKHEYSFNEGITLKYVDPENFISNYTEDPYFGDMFYNGEVKRIPILELKTINPKLTDEDIEEIRQLSSHWSSEYTMSQSGGSGVFDKDVVNVMFFNYKDDKKFIYKKKNLANGGSRAIRKDESFNPEEENEHFSKVDKTIDVWYEGALVLGSNKLIKWQLAKNMVRPDSAFQKTYSNYVVVAPKMYKGSFDSHVRRMMPFADMIQITHLKAQQVLQKIVPDGVFIDADGINEVDLGNGGTYSPQAALDLYFTTGSVVGRSYTGDGEFNNARVPIQELNSSSGQSKLISLTSAYNHYLNMIRDVTGINEAADASTPSAGSLVGLQKLAALNSNTATKHILDAGLFMTKRLAECVSYRIADVLEYAEDAEEFANQIGGYNLNILSDIKKLPLHSFGIFIEVSPDEEERAELEGNIKIAIQAGGIDLEDAIDVRAVPNIKMANELLKLKRKKKIEADNKREMDKINAQNESNMQSQQAAAQSKMQNIQAETQAKIEINKQETMNRIEALKAEAELKKELMATEFEYQMSLKSREVEGLKSREVEKEDRKDKRVDKQSTQQSELIDQRHNGKPPVNFESTEDTLDGFGLESFG